MKRWLLVPFVRQSGVLFAIVCSSAAIPQAADVKSGLLEKGIQYVQGSADVPAPDLNNGVIFQGTVKLTGTNLASSASLVLPDGSFVLVPQDAPDEFKLKKKYNKQSSLDSHFPDGTYTANISTAHDGNRVLVLALTGDLYPNTPRLTNFPAAQVLDAGAYFQFSWMPFRMAGQVTSSNCTLKICRGTRFSRPLTWVSWARWTGGLFPL